MDASQAAGIGAICLALIGLLTWVLKNKGEQDIWVREQAEKLSVTMERNTAATNLLSENVKKNTDTTVAMLEMLKKIIKTNNHI